MTMQWRDDITPWSRGLGLLHARPPDSPLTLQDSRWMRSSRYTAA